MRAKVTNPLLSVSLLKYTVWRFKFVWKFQLSFSTLMTHCSFLQATEGSVTNLQLYNITQPNDAVYLSALVAQSHDVCSIWILFQQILAKTFLYVPVICMIVETRCWLHLTHSALFKVAVPRHEGPHSSCCQRGWIHPQQTESRGCPQTCRVWGTETFYLI